jgi:hypothetical protein
MRSKYIGKCVRAVSFVAGMIVSLAALPVAATHEDDMTTSGTLIMAFANANGIVVITDSMQTRAGIQLTEPGQKLMKYNDQLVCAVAGLGKFGVPAIPKLSAEMLGVVAAYRDDEERQHKVTSMSQKLGAISGILRFYLDTIADANEITSSVADASNYNLELMLVGYDSDKKAKVGELELRAIPHSNSSGQRRWEFREVSNKVSLVTPQFGYALGGMWDVAGRVLKKPTGTNPVIASFAQTLIKDGGTSLSLSQMKSLGYEIMTRTEKKYKEVGGPRQTAILTRGAVQSVSQPSFPELPRPLKLVVFEQMVIGEGGMTGPHAMDFLLQPDMISIFEDVIFNKTPTPLVLDGNIFVNCKVRNSEVRYSGGFTFFDTTDTVSNSSLNFFHHGGDPDSAFAKHLFHDYQWTTINGSPP